METLGAITPHVYHVLPASRKDKHGIELLLSVASPHLTLSRIQLVFTVTFLLALHRSQAHIGSLRLNNKRIYYVRTLS